jgi:hypothetical protein
MKLKKAIIEIMDRDQLKQVCDELELTDVDRRSRDDMARKVSRNHRAFPEWLFQYLMEPEVKAVCELMGVSSKGRRNALIARLISPKTAEKAEDNTTKEETSGEGAMASNKATPPPEREEEQVNMQIEKKPDGNAFDQILAVQITVAWAGEAQSEPRRLGWWKTDLVDPAGGGDLLARLLPKTQKWASLEAVREAARRCDAKNREKMADSDKARTLFFLGFELDEQLDERLAWHKRSGVAPREALSLTFDADSAFSGEQVEKLLIEPGVPNTDVVPAGRQLKGGMPDDALQAVQALAAALVPFADDYPTPFYGVK